MNEKFAALVARESGVELESQADSALLAAGDVLVRVAFSGVNYKDALALCGKGKIIRSFPMIPGVDFAGEVVSSDSPDFSPGDKVAQTGAGAGEKKSGGFAEFARADSRTLARIPDVFSPRAAASIGTAGVTAALCVLALRDGGHVREGGDVAVSGASGGVGSFAIGILAKLGYKPFAVSRPQSADYLRTLGASEIIPREEMAAECRPLEKARWDGGVDAVGGKILARMLAETKYGGVVAACGLAAHTELETTVMPFILRGVRLDGIDSVGIPKPLRERAWRLLAETIDEEFVARVASEETNLSGAIAAARRVLAGETSGRVVVVPKP